MFIGSQTRPKSKERYHASPIFWALLMPLRLYLERPNSVQVGTGVFLGFSHACYQNDILGTAYHLNVNVLCNTN